MICKHCGEPEGEHNANDARCPAKVPYPDTKTCTQEEWSAFLTVLWSGNTFYESTEES